MRWMTAQKTQVCSACVEEINQGQKYYGNSYSSFCLDCGKLKQAGELVYEPNKKGYVQLRDKAKCDFCKETSTGFLHGKAVCDDHIGKAVDI